MPRLIALLLSVAFISAASRIGASDPDALREFQGSWRVLNATMNGLLVEDPKVTGATWSFQADTLVLTNGIGQTERFSLASDAGAPGALRLDPIAPSKDRGGWMIFKRDGDRLTLAFGDNLEGRPDSFAPARKKLVLTLARADRGPAVPAPCDALSAAGLAALLPGGVRQPDRERRAAGPACVFSDPQGREVALMVVPAAGRVAFDAEVGRLRKEPRETIQDEPRLGPAAVSAVQGYRVRFFVLKRETLVWLSFQLPGADIARLREFTRRAVAEVVE